MKKFLLLALLVTTSLFAQAQKNKKSPEERAQARVEKISEELNLTDTQEKEIYALFLSEDKKEKVAGKNVRDLSKEERQAYINARKNEKAVVYEKIANILDEDQFATFQSMDQSRRRPVKGSRGGDGKGKKDSADRMQSRVDKLTEELSLSPEQQTQVASLLRAQQANRAKGAAKKAASDEKMKAILNADQYATYQAGKSAKSDKGQRKGMKGNNNGASIENRVEKLTEKLQLSEAQQAQVTTILTKQNEARKANGGKTELSEAAKEARKAARKEAKAQLDADMKAVLTAEQYAIYEKESKGRGKGKGKRKGKGKKIEE